MARNNETTRYVGCDRSGIARVWGEAKQSDVAYTECAEAIRDYVRGRPDTGPTSSWLIEEAVS